MIGVIERIKNSVLLKCSTLNDELISKKLEDIIYKNIYHFAESLSNLVNNSMYANEDDIRNNSIDKIKTPIIKKLKRKLFIDSLALQITNDTFIEDYVNKKIDIKKLNKEYIKELNKNKNSNQLNMTEDLNLTEVMQNLNLYVEHEIISKVKENVFLTNAIMDLLKKTKETLEKELEQLIKQTDLKYLDILINDLRELVEIDDSLDENISDKDVIIEQEEGEVNMLDTINNEPVSEKINSEFEKYDDMTLFNKMILSLNTKEEKLSRQEAKILERKNQIEDLLLKTNQSIEANIERENSLSQRKLELNSREVELNSKLSEAEVIFLNIKPLIKGLTKIKDSNPSSDNGGNNNE